MKNLDVFAGQCVRFSCSIEPAEHGPLVGALEGDGTAPLLMEVQGDDLLTPALQAGLYRYEIRCGGVTVLAGHVHVLPSPLGAASGEAVLVAQADVSSPLVQCTVTLGVGPRGPQGYSAYETWLSLGNTGSEQDFVDSLVLLPEENDISTGSGTENINWRWVAIAGGLPDETYRIRAIRVPSRTANAAGLSSQALFLTVWMDDGNGQFSCVATSSNSITPQVAVDSVWEFDSAAQLIPGRWLRLCPTTDPSETWQGSHSIGGRIVKVSDGSMREKYAPSSHVDDVVVHLSAEEHAALAELLARKDDLLAGLDVTHE